MRNKARLIQHEYTADFESEFDHLIVVEDVPVASNTVRVPTPNTSFPLLSQIKN